MAKRYKYIFGFFAVLAATAAIVFFAGCSTSAERFSPYVSELRDNVFSVKTEKYSLEVITGNREEPFIMDGRTGNKRYFTVVTLDPKEAVAADILYSVSVSGVAYTGKLAPHPFYKTYSADIAAYVNANQLEIQITYNGATDALTAKSVKNEHMISASKAIEIADKRLKKRTDSFKMGKTYACEVYVRLIANPIDNSGGYHWYVAFVGESRIIYGALIDPVTMQIIAVRE